MKETQIKHTTNNSQGTKNVDNTHASELTFDKQITTAICPAKTKKDRGIFTTKPRSSLADKNNELLASEMKQYPRQRV